MPKAPVYYALAQARFNPVAAMKKYVCEVQDILRQKGYTLFEPQEIKQLHITAASKQSPETVKVGKSATWLITKPKRDAGFILGTSSLAYHTTDYETHNEFLQEFLVGLKAVHQIVRLDHLSRIGLRYLDAVLPDEKETVEQYLAKGLHGVPFEGRLRYGFTESVFETNSEPLIRQGTLIVRIHRAIAPLGYPPDLVPYGLAPMPRFDIKNVIAHAVVDTDHFVEGQMPLNFGEIEQQLISLHSEIKKSFDATITPYAKEVWN
ncbi:MAG: TIGR04255 family protein [Candidatus Omnitrophica bacterium]|nr:TIGR04255 family protein [Candidatus Omnitrophota bacterium]